MSALRARGGRAIVDEIAEESGASVRQVRRWLAIARVEGRVVPIYESVVVDAEDEYRTTITRNVWVLRRG